MGKSVASMTQEDRSKPVCVPSVLGPLILCFICPPLFVIVHEVKKPRPFSNGFNIIMSFLFTSLFYFPGVIHSLSIIRNEGTWTDNYTGNGL